jgi:hypothetical protein
MPELTSGIVTGTAMHPMKQCAFSGPVSGLGVHVTDQDGWQFLPPKPELGAAQSR